MTDDVTAPPEVLENSPPLRPWKLLLGPVLGFVVYLILGDVGLSPEGRRLSGLAVCTVLWWLLEAAAPAVVGLAFAVGASLLGVASTEKVLAPFGNPIIFFFMGSFFLARAIEEHGVAVNLLRRLLALSLVKDRPTRASRVLTAMTGVVSGFLNNTATAALFLPFGVALARHSFKKSKDCQSRVILGVAYAASVGGLLTTFGTAPTLIALGILNASGQTSISFVEWFCYSLPVALPLLGFLIWRAADDSVSHSNRHEHEPHRDVEALSTAGRRSLGLVAVAMLLLVLVSAVPALAFIGETNAILGPALLVFVLPAGSRAGPLLTWREATQIDWQSLLLFGAGLSLGALLFSTGVAQVLGESLRPLAAHPFLFFATLVLVMLLLTEIASNTASVTLLVPIVVATCVASDLPTKPFVAAVAITASLGFMMPVGTPPNALAYGTGHVPMRRMIREGVAVDLVGYLLVLATFWLWHL